MIQDTGKKDNIGCCGENSGSTSQVSACCDTPPDRIEGTPHWFSGRIETACGKVPVVEPDLTRADRIGEVLVRLNIRRMHYALDPGLYALGSPTKDSPVYVTANYKLSFDHLRRALKGLSGWILVLDTSGINVWCAAGKGTFGTDELVNRIESVNLGEIVTHRTLILPQLGAPGVAAHQVKKRSGFRVIYGPVRAVDIRAFMNAGKKAEPEMRLVRFGLLDRIEVIPVEMVIGGKFILLIMGLLFLLAGLNREGYDLGVAYANGSEAALFVLFAFLGGTLLTPLLLPWIPGRAFSVKGAIVGLCIALCISILGCGEFDGIGCILYRVSWFLVLPALSAFFAMSFTGATTFTSLSGVKQEIRFFLPVQIVLAVTGFGLWIALRFV